MRDFIDLKSHGYEFPTVYKRVRYCQVSHKISKLSNEVDLYIFLYTGHSKTWATHFFGKLWPNNGREYFKNHK